MFTSHGGWQPAETYSRTILHERSRDRRIERCKIDASCGRSSLHSCHGRRLAHPRAAALGPARSLRTVPAALP